MCVCVYVCIYACVLVQDIYMYMSLGDLMGCQVNVPYFSNTGEDTLHPYTQELCDFRYRNHGNDFVYTEEARGLRNYTPGGYGFSDLFPPSFL